MKSDPQELLRLLSRADVALTVQGDKLKYRGPQRLCTDEMLNALRTHKSALMRTLKVG
jgi:TubC N-terminal docking domain